jgi:hypothetical protein
MSVQEQNMMTVPSVARSREWKKIIPKTKNRCHLQVVFFWFCFGQGDKLQIYLQMVVSCYTFGTKLFHKPKPQMGRKYALAIISDLNGTRKIHLDKET